MSTPSSPVASTSPVSTSTSSATTTSSAGISTSTTTTIAAPVTTPDDSAAPAAPAPAPTTTSTSTSTSTPNPTFISTSPDFGIKVHEPFTGGIMDANQVNRFLQSLELLFRLNSVTSDERKITILAFNLVQNALEWFQHYSADHDVYAMTYQDFLSVFKKRFEGSVDQSRLYRQLMELRQTGSIDDYIKEFDKKRIALSSKYYTPEGLREAFIKGLKPYLRQCLKMNKHEVVTYSDAARMAADIEHEEELKISSFSKAASTLRIDTAKEEAVFTINTSQLQPRRGSRQNGRNRRPPRERSNFNSNNHTNGRSFNKSAQYRVAKPDRLSFYRKNIRELCDRFHLCHYCRQPGHVLAECPERAARPKPEQ